MPAPETIDTTSAPTASAGADVVQASRGGRSGREIVPGLDPPEGGRPLLAGGPVLAASVAGGDLVAFNEPHAAFFPADPPARMTVQVPLPHGLPISIDCIAVVADGT